MMSGRTPSLMKQVKDPLEVIDDPGLESQLETVGFSQEDLFGEDVAGLEDDAEPSKESAADPEPSEEAEGGIPMGARISANFDGDIYEGKVTSIASDGRIVVAFDDGDVGSFRADELTFLDEPSSEPSEAPEPSEDPEPAKDEEEPLCHGKEKYFEEGSDCDDCPWLSSCRNEIKLHPTKGKTIGKAALKEKGKRGRPKGSTTKKATSKEGSTPSSLASKIVGRSKNKK